MLYRTVCPNPEIHLVVHDPSFQNLRIVLPEKYLKNARVKALPELYTKYVQKNQYVQYYF